MPYQRLAAAILEEWRAVEGQLVELGPGAPGYAAAKAEAERLRREYERLFLQARAHHRPEPPPFPGSDQSLRQAGPPPDRRCGAVRLDALRRAEARGPGSSPSCRGRSTLPSAFD